MKFGLIGEHLTHSFSKEIHSFIGDYSYEIKEIAPENLEAFIKEKNFSGINVTIPYKEAVIPYLDYVDESALEIGAVNTVVNKHGKLYGYNTDYYGMKALIERAQIEIKGKTVLIIGTGGTSKTAHKVLGDMGADKILFVSYREVKGAYTYDEIYRDFSDKIDVIINTSPVGMYPKNEGMPIDITRFTKLSGLVDVIYNPLRTNLVQTAEKMHVKSTNGLYMLSAQAVFAAEYFGLCKAEEKLCENVYLSALDKKDNIVLIGMPSCGKSSIGKLLAQKTGKTLVDTDEEIVKKIGMDIKSFFTTHSEAEFRLIESQVTEEISKGNNQIIATGGGIILNYDNIRRLKQNGTVYFIDRSLELLQSTLDRPLSSSREALEKRYNERYSIYTDVADNRVNGDKTVREVAELILKERRK